jgi:hypothetical protein
VKRIFLGMLVFAMAGTTNAKNMHKIFGTSDKIIKGAPIIQIYSIDPIPVMSVEQVQGEDYIYDYHVIKAWSFKKKAANKLVVASLDTTQYLAGIAKKCPFMGKYAIHFKKGMKSLTIIVSTQPCDKVIIFCPGTVIDKKHIDIMDNSALVAAIEALVNPIVQVNNKKV